MKLPDNKLKLRSGKVVQFKSAAKRDTFERLARAIHHGWKPTKNK